MPNFTLKFPSPLIRYTDWAKTASTAYAIGVLADADNSTGLGFDKADATSTRHIGVVQETVASADSDYATATVRENLLVDPMGEYIAAVGAGTPTAAYEGYHADLDSAGQVDVGNNSVNVFLIHKFLTASYVQGFITQWGYWV